MRAKFNIVGETAEFAAFGLIVRAQSVTEYMLIEPARKRLCCGDPRENILNVFERGDAWPIVAKADINIELDEWHELLVTVVDKKIDSPHSMANRSLRTVKFLIQKVDSASANGSQKRLSTIWRFLIKAAQASRSNRMTNSPSHGEC